MTFEEDFKKFEQSYRQYYGKNYDKALNNLKITKKRLRHEFKKKYPNAHISRFSFNVVLSKTGDVTGTSVSFKIRDDQFFIHYNKDVQRVRSILESCTGLREYGLSVVRLNLLF